MKALNLLRVVAHANWGSDEATLLHSVVDPFQTGLRCDRLWLSEKVCWIRSKIRHSACAWVHFEHRQPQATAR